MQNIENVPKYCEYVHYKVYTGTDTFAQPNSYNRNFKGSVSVSVSFTVVTASASAVRDQVQRVLGVAVAHERVDLASAFQEGARPEMCQGGLRHQKSA